MRMPRKSAGNLAKLGGIFTNSHIQPVIFAFSRHHAPVFGDITCRL